MFKIDKNTHLMILFTFALIFLVVYLYYTIVDVRKIQREVKSLADEVATIKGRVSNCQKPSGTSCPSGATAKPSVHPQTQSHTQPGISSQAQGQGKAPTVVAEVVTVSIPSPVPDVQVVEKPAPKTGGSFVIEDDDDDDSVQTEEIRDALDCTDDEEIPVKQQEHVEPPAPLEATTSSSLESILDSAVETGAGETDIPGDLSKLKYEDLRELCKKVNINSKGSKEVLLKRLSELKNNV